MNEHTTTYLDWTKTDDGYTAADGLVEVTDNGGGFGPSAGSGRWAVTIDGEWHANYDTLAAAQSYAAENVAADWSRETRPTDLLGYCTEHEAGACYPGCPNAYGDEDRELLVLVESAWHDRYDGDTLGLEDNDQARLVLNIAADGRIEMGDEYLAAAGPDALVDYILGVLEPVADAIADASAAPDPEPARSIGELRDRAMLEPTVTADRGFGYCVCGAPLPADLKVDQTHRCPSCGAVSVLILAPAPEPVATPATYIADTLPELNKRAAQLVDEHLKVTAHVELQGIDTLWMADGSSRLASLIRLYDGETEWVWRVAAPAPSYAPAWAARNWTTEVVAGAGR